MEPTCLFKNKPYPACRCGDSRLAMKTNHNFLSKCGQCKNKWRGPLCSNCGFHCCLHCRKQNQNHWKTTVSKLSHWNDNALKQQQEFKKTLQLIPQIFILYNNKELVKTLCSYIYNTRNKEIMAIFLDIINNNDKVLLSAFYDKFQDTIHSRNLSELLHFKYLNIINKKYLHEFRKKNGINILHYICTINISIKNMNINIQMIKIILELIIKYKLLHRDIYDIQSIFEFSSYCNNKYETEIINILNIYINAEIKERGLRKWIDGYSLIRLPLYDYVSWKYYKKIPFYIMKWIVINTINYKIVPYFLTKYKNGNNYNDKKNGRYRSRSLGVNKHINRNKKPEINVNKSLSPKPNRIGNNENKFFKTYNRIMKPLLIMENIYFEYKKIIYKWMNIFIDLDSEMILLKSCEKHSLPLIDAIELNSNMVSTMMKLCSNELYNNYSLHLFIDIACINPKMEYKILQWIQICIEKYEKRLLFKNYKHLSPLQYAETHKNYYCSQIILYLKRKLQKYQNYNQLINDKNIINIINNNQKNMINKLNINDESIVNINDNNNICVIQNEILCLKNENIKWKEKYFKLNTMYTQLLNEKGKNRLNNGINHNRTHSYPTPKGDCSQEIKDNENDDLNRDNNGYLIKGYREWDCNDIVNWIMNLNIKYKKYENILKSNIIKENIRGIHLSLLNRNDLSRLGINDFGDKYDIIEQIRVLLNNSNQIIQKEGVSILNEGNGKCINDNNCTFQYPSPYN